MIIEVQFFAEERVICCFNICANKIKGVNLQPQANPRGELGGIFMEMAFSNADL